MRIFAEIYLPHPRCGIRVYLVSQQMKPGDVSGEKEKSLILAVVKTRENDRPANRAAKGVIPKLAIFDEITLFIDRCEEIAGIGVVVTKKLVNVAVEVV